MSQPLTNCINCGGQLKDGICPFCDTDYRQKIAIVIDLDQDQVTAKIRYQGEEFDAYLSHMDIEPIVTEPCRDERGILHMTKVGTIRKWEFVQSNVTFK